MTTFKYKLTAGREPLNIDDFRRLAKRKLPDMVWAFFDYGSEDQTSMEANREAFARWALRQRVLAGNDPVDLSTTIAGEHLSMPIMLAPTGLSGLVHWEGERAAAQAAERAGTLAVLSTASSYSYEEVAEATRRDHFFQLYPYPSKDEPGSMQNSIVSGLMDRAQAAGYRAMFVTADVPVSGNKEHERRRGLGKPPVMTPRRAFGGARHPRWAYGFMKHQRMSMRNLVDDGGAKAAVKSLVQQERMMRRELSWEDLEWMRKRWNGPLFVKGILEADDAARAVDAGVDGIVVSNHGGRQLDGAVASLDALPAIAERVGGKTQILLDGGIRRGTDVIKALALGADAVLIGRPYLYGLGVDGGNGVQRVLEILAEEMERALTIMGVKSLKALDGSCVLPAGMPIPGNVDVSELTAAHKLR